LPYRGALLNPCAGWLLCLSLVLLLSGCRPETDSAARPLLTVNDWHITRAEFASAFAKAGTAGQALTAGERQELERAFLRQLIDRELSLAAARQRGLAITPAELAAALDEHRRDYPAGGFEAMLRDRGMTGDEWQAELAQSLLIGKLMDEVVSERGQVGEAEIAAYYAAHRADFDRPAQVRARQIVVADRAAGDRVLARLRQGEEFAAVARAVSLSPDAQQGGDLGFFGRGEMPVEFEAVFELPVGSLSPLVKSDYGYHLFLVEEQRPATHLSRREAEATIRLLLTAERRETVYQEWLQELRGQATIAVDWPQLEAHQ